MKKVYLDNAATTSLREEVKEAMHDSIDNLYGNPSALYEYGRQSKNEVETARQNVAKLLGAKPGEIFFTSGGTESTNSALWSTILNGNVERIITSPIEHHATHSTAEFLADKFGLELVELPLDAQGNVQLEKLAHILADGKPTLVTLMNANNEVGNITDINALSKIGDQEHVTLHVDMVQTIGHYEVDFSSLPGIDFASGSSHKYHGPKGIGILYIKEGTDFRPLIIGGSQERNMRAGTENLFGVIGLNIALTESMKNLSQEQAKIQELKDYAINQIKEELPEAIFHGDPEGQSLYTVVNIGLPETDKSSMLIYHLDMKGYSLSGGSACTSGIQSSHVIQGIYGDDHKYTPLRISLSKDNSREDIDGLISEIKEFIKK